MSRGLRIDGKTGSESSGPRMPPLALFPLSYALHVAEEAWGGESFPVWASRLSGASFSLGEFVVLNGAAFAAMCIAVVLPARWPRMRHVVIPALGTIVAGNGAAHVVASLWTSTYSPGLISGALVWVPLGTWALRWAALVLPARQCWVGCAVGAFAHLAVSAIAWFH